MNAASRSGQAHDEADGESSLVDRLAELEQRLLEMERRPRLRARGRGMIDRVVPPEATRHFRNAGRENLMGMRTIVDFWIRRIDDMDERATRAPEREEIEIS